jgi:diacylglycerol kinase (ATP)
MAGRIVLAVNPHASFGKNATAGQQVLDALRAAGFDVVLCEADNYRDLCDSVVAAVAVDTSALVVVGGDGMVHLGVQVARDTGVPLGVIPTGTGNDLARHLDIPLGAPPGNPDAAVASFLKSFPSEPRRIDLGVSTGPDGVETPFGCVLSAGFDAIVNERANRLRFPKGRHRYTLALLIELARLRPISYQLVIDGVDHSGEYLLVAVANSRSFGGGMKVTPEAELDDGWLDVFVLTPLSRFDFLRIYPQVFAGTHVRDPRVRILRGRQVHLEATGVVAYADGEAVSALPIDVRVEPGVLQVYA